MGLFDLARSLSNPPLADGTWQGELSGVTQDDRTSGVSMVLECEVWWCGT